MNKLLIATRRQGKLKEFKAILKDLNLHLLTLADINFPNIEPEENGQSFKENAEIKAKFYGQKAKLPTLADDSGLIVDVLPNKLGVRTKRYTPGTDKDRYLKLLQELTKAPNNKRTARFKAAISFYDPKKNDIVKTTIGTCEGKISQKPKGKNGFGFDPVFIPNNKDKINKNLKNKHLAQLTLNQKNKISHRSKALKKITKYLKQYFQNEA